MKCFEYKFIPYLSLIKIIVFQAEYNELAGQLADYVVKLLDKVQGNEELNVLLNNSEGMEHTSNKILARLQLAIDYKEKKVSALFIVHSSEAPL